MTGAGARLSAVVLVAAALASGTALAQRGPRGTSNLAEIRGPVVRLTAAPGEGDLDVVAVEIDDGRAVRPLVLLGPASMLEEAGFAVAEGDVLRVKVFVGDDDDGTVTAMRVLNHTRRAMVRLRTFHRDPLWDTSGRWQGAGYHGGGEGRGGPAPPRTPERNREGGASRGAP